ncbi:alkene reductase (plasmid) [Burkholderia sp. THE68]|uniref:alkene reductase n=1 Tax=Burkholderia sp. THE68 TaxID=758782 RepID=UPI001316512B|nr:alkene reductase [Burkholderia sp. THE68]BBU32499.1 alkene reductase [Burkholderia sp. THE68]
MSKLFECYDLSGLPLPNRVVMAPMTRSRAPDTVADEQTALYYQQRASAGLIITEGSQISVEGRGYLFTPGIHTLEQVAGWKRVTEAVHQQGGRIFIQIWHVGRISHVTLQPDGNSPVSSVDVVAADATAFGYNASGNPDKVPVSHPRALAADEIQRVTRDFVEAARNAMAAGFDGVELHGANGYLFEQFLNDGLNSRKDEYGGTLENRMKFLLETVDAVSEAIGASKTAIRISPFGRLHDMKPYSDEEDTWLTVARELSARNLAYVHLSDQLTLGQTAIDRDFLKKFRAAYRGTLILAGGFQKAEAEQALKSGIVDLIGFGRPYISNPDLVERLRDNAPLAPVDRSTMYGGGSRGYTDYPRYEESSMVE